MNKKNLLIIVLIMTLTSCAKNKPDNLGVTNQKLSPCPAKPNCVSSDTSNEQHMVDSLQLANNTWEDVIKAVSKLPNTKIIESNNTYIHAESTSRVFGFVDDLELHNRPENKIIAVRSASRTGYSDFSVNRNRVEALRTLLTKK